MAIATRPLYPIDVATGKGDQPEKALGRLADALRERGADGDRRDRSTPNDRLVYGHDASASD
jgi:hypothetical protein